MDLGGWELVLGVLNDHSCQLREVFRDFGRALLHDQQILIAQLQQEVRIRADALKERFWLQDGW